jgi:hypothetical protein
MHPLPARYLHTIAFVQIAKHGIEKSAARCRARARSRVTF